jgi:transposase
MSFFKYIVHLTSDEKSQISNFLRSESASRKLTRARILLLADAGLIDSQIAEILQVSRSTVVAMRRRFVRSGLMSAINDRPRTGRTTRLDKKQRAILIAVASGQPPKGHRRWTLRLLAQKIVQLGFTKSICHETVRAILNKARRESLSESLSLHPGGLS